MGLTDSYSGVVINQNAISSGNYAWRSGGANWVYQTFALPSSYIRGSQASSLTIPDISGFQVMCNIDTGYAAAAALDYALDYYGGTDVGWQPLTSGTIIGAQADGGAVWFDIILPQSVAITPALTGKQFRLGVYGRTVIDGLFNQPAQVATSGAFIVEGQGYTVTLTDGVPYPITIGGQPAFLLQNKGVVTYSLQQGINTLSYVTPTPLTSSTTGAGQAYQSDQLTPLLGHGTTASLNFRVLGLVADSGQNFLNNEYRSAVIQSAGGNVSTTDGLQPTQGSAAGATYYMSPPMPSQFSVVSMYLDVRPVAETPIIGMVNAIGNPSFEYDAPGYAPAWWSAYNSGATVVDQTVKSISLPTGNVNYTPWAGDNYQSLHMKYTFAATSEMAGINSPILLVPATTDNVATPLAFSMAYDVIALSNASLKLVINWYDTNQVFLTSVTQTIATTTGINTYQYNTTVPANAGYVQYQIQAVSSGSGSFEGYVDEFQITYTSSNVPYFDGDSLGCQWAAQKGQSDSLQVFTSDAEDDAVVLDGVLVDPITPNMAFNVYYSTDDAYTSDSMTETDWEQKLWTRVPQVYIAIQRNTFAFPQPVSAKYMKIEFTNLPAQTYDPGPLQKPVSYKKFPTWVANFFIGMMESPSFTASLVNVQYDALQFAYDYYLDDLDQTPASPTTPPVNLAAQLTTYFNATPTGLDANTLAQINLNMQPYQQPIAGFADTSTMLGSYVSGLTSSNVPQVSEGGIINPVDYSTVSTLAREPIVMEQSTPVMFFFLTCRHAYKQLTATFDYNRAYFAGVNDVAFIRNDYTVQSDTPLYIESGGDTANIQTNDWYVDPTGNWYTYDG